MEAGKWDISFGDESDEETNDKDSYDDEEEYCYASLLVAKLQPRKVVSKAHWINEMGMAEVVVLKGPIWRTTGIVRSGKIYCSIEEVLFLAELGALLLMDDSDSCLSIEDMYMKISDIKSGCCWEYFQAYRQLKSLGYIVGRHNVPWSLKGVNCQNGSVPPHCSLGNGEVDMIAEDKTSIIGMFSSMHIDEVRPVFDVFLPNSKFRKSSPGDPSFVLCFTRGYPPSKETLELQERQCRGVPLKFCQVEQGRVSFFSFDKVVLPVLP